jgi:hypothetical protein
MANDHSGAKADFTLRAGPLRLEFDAGDLRYVKLDEREIIRRMYAAVRDHNWVTVPSDISDLVSEVREDQFHIRYTSTHRLNEVHFVWKAEIIGQQDGTIRFAFDGEAKSTFRRNRIGFCVLHPIRECSGAKARATFPDGSEMELAFPDFLTAEQPVPGFQDLAGLAHEIEPGLWAELKFDGDFFEMEDQRNWIDASFKTFCTPLRIPFPMEIKAGTRVKQGIRFEIRDHRGADAKSAPEHAAILEFQSKQPVSIRVGNTTRALPPIGLGIASHGQPLTPKEIEQLSLLRLGHLRCDARLSEPRWEKSLLLAHEQTVALQIPLELAVHLARDNPELELQQFAVMLRESKPAVARVLLFREGERTISQNSFRVAKPHLSFLGVPLGAGTNADFYELNRFRPPHAEADFVHWSMNPQVHAFDLRSLAETPTAIPSQLKSAAEFFPGEALVVSPVTLKPRFNAVATGPEAPPAPGELPPQVDPRQLSPFAACWTLGIIKYLAEGGVRSMTFFETTGWRGVMERMTGSLLPEKFPSMPGQLFPVYHALAAINRFAGGEVILSQSSSPLRVESICLTNKDSACFCLANMTGERERVIVSGFGRADSEMDLEPFEIRSLEDPRR